jgi:hypothetical protein
MGIATATPDPQAWERLVQLLAPRLGHEQGTDVLSDAATRLGLQPEQIEFAQALELLDELARSEGLVGVVARFAKARLMLRTEQLTRPRALRGAT